LVRLPVTLADGENDVLTVRLPLTDGDAARLRVDVGVHVADVEEAAVADSVLVDVAVLAGVPVPLRVGLLERVGVTACVRVVDGERDGVPDAETDDEDDTDPEPLDVDDWVDERVACGVVGALDGLRLGTPPGVRLCDLV
jgi:hypothetical protein